MKGTIWTASAVALLIGCLALTAGRPAATHKVPSGTELTTRASIGPPITLPVGRKLVTLRWVDPHRVELGTRMMLDTDSLCQYRVMSPPNVGGPAVMILETRMVGRP